MLKCPSTLTLAFTLRVPTLFCTPFPIAVPYFFLNPTRRTFSELVHFLHLEEIPSFPPLPSNFLFFFLLVFIAPFLSFNPRERSPRVSTFLKVHSVDSETSFPHYLSTRVLIDPTNPFPYESSKDGRRRKEEIPRRK